MKPLLILCSVLLLNVAGRGEDLYPLRLSPFLKKYLEQPGYAYPLKGGRYSFIDLRPWTDDFKTGGQQLIRTDNNLYIFIQSTSRVYKAIKRDSLSIYFKRIDSTLGIFYNIGSYQFSDGEDLYSYGGYGFWKTNGLLRKFNFKQGEWDVVPLNEEVIAQINPGFIIWYDPSRKKLHVPFQQIVNEGVAQIKHEIGEIDDTSWELDLLTKTWKRVGNAHPSLIKIAKKANPDLNYSSHEGAMLESIGQVVWLDYKNNVLRQSGNNPLVQAMNRNTFLYDIIYLKDNKLHYYNTQNLKTDSLDLSSLPTLSLLPVVERNSKLFWAAGGAVLSVLAIGVVVRVRSKRKSYKLRDEANTDEEKAEKAEVIEKQKFEIAEEESTQSLGQLVEIEMEVEKTEGQLTLFNATEKDLIVLCLERSEAGGFADIDEINHVLGIKNKNKGLQKKVRSEVFNSVNNKFREYAKSNSGLIESVRNKNDKRYFDYYIESRNFSSIRSMLRLS